MGLIVTSIFVKKNILSIIILEDGKLQVKDVEKIKDKEIASSMYTSLIYGFTKALRLTRNYLEQNNSSKVIFEISNSIFAKWLSNRYSKPAYQTAFSEMLEIMEAIPMQYCISVKSKPQACVYADEKYLTNKVKLGGLDLEENE